MFPTRDPAQCSYSDARRQPVIVHLDFFAPKYPALNSGTIAAFLLKNETIVIIYHYAIFFPLGTENELFLSNFYNFFSNLKMLNLGNRDYRQQEIFESFGQP